MQAPDFTQSFNRYSYVWNNPLRYTDPTGEFVTWGIGNGGFSIGFNLTPIGTPFGAGVNIGWTDGTSVGGYYEVGFRVGGSGFGSGATISQSWDYNFKHSNWSFTTSAGAYASLGLFNSGGSVSSTYDFNNKTFSNDWGVSAGFGSGNGTMGMGYYVGYGSGGLSYGLGGYYNPPRPQVYKSPVSKNHGVQNGECAYRCLEEFSASYDGMGCHDFGFWFQQNDFQLGVHPSKVEPLIDNTGLFASSPIYPQMDIKVIAHAFESDQRVMMGFITESVGGHAVMVRKLKIYSSGRYRVYFAETSPGRIAPYSTSNINNRLPGARFWTFSVNK